MSQCHRQVQNQLPMQHIVDCIYYFVVTQRKGSLKILQSNRNTANNTYRWPDLVRSGQRARTTSIDIAILAQFNINTEARESRQREIPLSAGVSGRRIDTEFCDGKFTNIGGTSPYFEGENIHYETNEIFDDLYLRTWLFDQLTNRSIIIDRTRPRLCSETSKSNNTIRWRSTMKPENKLTYEGEGRTGTETCIPTVPVGTTTFIQFQNFWWWCFEMKQFERRTTWTSTIWRHSNNSCSLNHRCRLSLIQ